MKPERDLHAEQELVDKSFDMLCPHVRGNRFIPQWPLPAQAAFLGLHQRLGDDKEVFQALFGGAAGPGKSSALLMGSAQYVHIPSYAGICFRRHAIDLTQPDALLDRAWKWWLPRRDDGSPGAVWQAKKSTFHFPSGARIVFAHLSNPRDHLKYQGAAYQYSAWDELTQWDHARQYEYVGLSRLRRLSSSDQMQIPLRTLSASNPGGPGHNWVMEKFVGGIDSETGEEIIPQHPYVPARLVDNPYLDRETYIRTLMHLHPTVREQLLNGDWRAREQGDYFRAEWFGELLDPEVDTWAPEECVRVRWWDLAGSTKAGASKTSGVRMARHLEGDRAIEHCRSGRWTPGTRDDVILQTAAADGKSVIVGIEIEPGSGGLAQFLSLEKRLKQKGFTVVGVRPTALRTPAHRERFLIVKQGTALTAKVGRADPVAACLERGYIRRGEAPMTLQMQNSSLWGIDRERLHARDGLRCFRGAWTRSFFDSIEGFPPESGKEGVDDVDAMSGAWAWTEANPAGLRRPARPDRKPQIKDPDADYDTMEEEQDQGRDTAGHWTP